MSEEKRFPTTTLRPAAKDDLAPDDCTSGRDQCVPALTNAWINSSIYIHTIIEVCVPLMCMRVLCKRHAV